jgi:RimJ/RimL family protein N-acetyltransferase
VRNWDRERTARLLLRRPTENDVGHVYAIHCDPETNRHNPAGPIGSLDEARSMLAEWLEHWRCHGFGYWIVRAGASGAPIGVGGVHRRELDGDTVLNLYYRFTPSAWGKGLATELARAAVSRGRREFPSLPIAALVHPANAASAAVARKAGMTKAGETQHNGGLRLVYMITPDERAGFEEQAAGTGDGTSA